MSLQKVLLYLTISLTFSCQGQGNSGFIEKINGLSFVASNRKLVEKDIEPVLNVNANWVALMPFGFMPSSKNPELRFNTKWQWWGETAKGIQITSSIFQKKKIQRMLKPQLWIKGGSFTGLISMSNEEDWIQFEKNYEDFILHYAKLAQDEHIELFCIGTELNLFVKNRQKFWKDLIAKTKQIYSGKITYAANWDSYANAIFWKDLDYIGIDAYFPLASTQTPSVAKLNQAWKATKTALKKFSKKKKKSIIFTEYGYRSIDFCAKQPWVSDTKGNYNNIAQQNALTAIFQTFWKEPWFAGGFLWKWFDDQENAGGKNHTGFTVQNKKTEKLVKKFYKSQRITNE
jgi:hypothetical protein